MGIVDARTKSQSFSSGRMLLGTLNQDKSLFYICRMTKEYPHFCTVGIYIYIIRHKDWTYLFIHNNFINIFLKNNCTIHLSTILISIGRKKQQSTYNFDNKCGVLIANVRDEIPLLTSFVPKIPHFLKKFFTRF